VQAATFTLQSNTSAGHARFLYVHIPHYVEWSYLLRFNLRMRAVGKSWMLHSAAVIRRHPALKERKRPVDHKQK